MCGLRLNKRRILYLTTLNNKIFFDDELIKKLRKNKSIIGTSLHLTVTVRNLLNYVKRIKMLLDLRGNITSEKKWENLINDYSIHDKSKNSLRRFFVSHIDLLALEIVEHTAQKGEKYIADNKKEYILFQFKGFKTCSNC